MLWKNFLCDAHIIRKCNRDALILSNSCQVDYWFFLWFLLFSSIEVVSVSYSLMTSCKSSVKCYAIPMAINMSIALLRSCLLSI